MHTCPVLYIALPYSIASQILLHIVIPYCILHCFILYSVRGGAELRWALSLPWDETATIHRRGCGGASVASDDGWRSLVCGACCGVAAALRAQKMHSKYREACLRIDSTFRDGVIERYGHCGDGLVGLVRLIAGAMRVWGIGNRWRQTTLSRVMHVAQCVPAYSKRDQTNFSWDRYV
jgi:hypothetical protein